MNLLIITIIICIIFYYIIPILELQNFNIRIDNYENQNKTKIFIITDRKTIFHWLDIKKYFKPNITILDMDDYEQFIDTIKKIDKKNITNIDIIIYSNGGSVDSNNMYLFFINELKLTFTINTYVYKYAMSAATLLFLTGDNLYMDEYDYISPTDTQIPIKDDSYQSTDILNTNYLQLSFQDNILYNSTKRSHIENIQIVNSLLEPHVQSKKKKNKLMKILSYGYLSHTTPLGASYLQSTGLRTEKIPSKIRYIYDNIFNYI